MANPSCQSVVLHDQDSWPTDKLSLIPMFGLSGLNQRTQPRIVLQPNSICRHSKYYSNNMQTEVLSCGPCTMAARSGEGGTVGRWLAWDPAILSQLSEAHRTMFPAILTSRCSVDKNVVRLLRDRTKGNTMVKVWWQIQENHFEEYLKHKDLYTTLLVSLVEPGGIVSALGHTFQAPLPPRELPSEKLNGRIRW